ncbi:3'-5' exonuclease [Ktedonobacter sp. SOSP1-52]|uniref:3'-5' exonuclease n=1 Tax=Ktedonobacter sp. SOSP1-52 TaxID=2778366 RepID=UPI001915DBA8|nr:3'-5' exonuclease [Ktedonobacter sp. SOSP1-52]
MRKEEHVTADPDGDVPAQLHDEMLFGWDPTPGIVSVWATRAGNALVWQRQGGVVSCSNASFRPWLFARTLEDLPPLHAHPPATLPWDRDQSPISSRLLEGSDGSYRYLLSARDGHLLERMLLAGASRRLGRQVTSLGSLWEDYYRVGPVEQYLMQTGRAFFRGLAYDDLHRLQFDVETTSLDPSRGRIFLVAIRDNHGHECIVEAPTPKEEPALVTELCAVIRRLDPDVIENHNLFGFDLPFLEARAKALRVPLLLGRSGAPLQLESFEEAGAYRRKRKRFSVAGRELIDTLDAVRRYDFVARSLPSYRLKEVARHFGMAAPERVYIEGSKIYETYQRDPDLVRTYAFDDVCEVDAISRRLMGAAFALAGMAPRRYERVASAGPAMGILEPMIVRAYVRAGAALPCYTTGQEERYGQHQGGASYLLAEGVAEHVVKADVASLYPSLIRAFRIAPKCDRLGVFLHFMDRLTELRLFHKRAAREAPAGSMEGNQHDGTQAAMKTVINAAYGYLGATSMALFADLEAANEVTRRGRALLDSLLASLRERGMVPIEADTDGVYFAVPSEWGEEQERALVSEVGATLPDGVKLEYEARYGAMLSHAIKNYALLTYSGEVIVRGAAMRSSRSEPYGERFLRQALRCVMQGDLVGVEQGYQETLRALRTRSLPTSDVATRFRLSKDAQTYLAGRARQKEAQYEALLLAGRRQWKSGEHVRFYRASNGTPVWLPDDIDDISPLEDAEEDRGETMRVAPPSSAFGRSPAYDSDYYQQVLLNSYAERLRVAFEPEDFAQLFRLDAQTSFFDRPVEQMHIRWIRYVSEVSVVEENG